MKKSFKDLLKGATLAGLAIAVGASVAYGVDADDSYYSTGAAGSAVVGGDLVVKPGDGAETGIFQVGSDSTKNVRVFTDLFSSGSGIDALQFGTGIDVINFGIEDGSIQFESTFGGDPDDDMIEYNAGSGVTDDELTIQADNVVIHANNGDVIIQLGYTE